MYKVLIIDDEEPLREAIRILGDWEKLGVERVLEATDGKIGLSMLEEHKIDLVIVDMKMPEMNGVELLRVIEREYQDLLTIVISGYNDFEYTRQAIHAKVVDYLLKPVNRRDLNEALLKAINVLEAKRKMKSEHISKNITLNLSLPKLKEKVYISLIERSFKNQMNETFLPLIGADDAMNRFATVVLRVLNLEAVSVGRFHNDVDLLRFAIANVIDEIASDHFHCFSFASPKEEREMIAVITMKGGYREDMVYRSVHQMKRVSATLAKLFGIVALVGIGDLCDEALDIADSYDNAKASINGVDLLKLNGSAVTNEAAQSFHKDNLSISSRIPMIRSALENGSIQHAKGIMGDLAKSWKSSGGFSVWEADRTARELVVLLNDIALELKVSPERLLIGGDHALRMKGISADYTDFGQYESLLNRILEYYVEEIRKALTVNRPFDVGDIKSFIDNHYFEDIKISVFSDKYFLSREYLMKLFKQEFGTGIHEYVQKVRMDKAKELLDDRSLKIQDISEMLGYKDKNYFSKAFRNYYSYSPTEYRENRMNG
ncbi:response regulator [Cohnella suwonensis]|uniref:Response regulator n=1 Tax=Cohnella suwonensis TaxID=696072 RepID=A0ABW0M0K3_9BACL